MMQLQDKLVHHQKLFSESLMLPLDKLVGINLLIVSIMLLLDKLVHHKLIYCVNDATAK